MTASAGKRLRITVSAEAEMADALLVAGPSVKDFIANKRQQCLYRTSYGTVWVRRTRAGNISVSVH